MPDADAEPARHLLALIIGLIALSAITRWAVLESHPDGEFAFCFLPGRAKALL